VLEVTRPISLRLWLSVSPLEYNLEMYYTEDSQQDFIGKATLDKIKQVSIKKN